MAILKAVNPKTTRAKLIKNIINYVTQDKKTSEILMYGKDVLVEKAAEQMNQTKDFWNKKTGREYYHFVQSFPPNEEITPSQALEVAKDFLDQAKIFDDYEVLLATHRDKEHIHTHFIVNSVSIKTGLKFQYSKNDLAMMKQLQDEICQSHGFSKAPKKGESMYGTERRSLVANDRKTYEILKKAEKKEVQSYVRDCAFSILEVSKKAKSIPDFVEKMGERGFKTKWDETKKHIVFTSKERENERQPKTKVRLAKLFDYYNLPIFTKDELKRTFETNLHSEDERYERIKNGIKNISQANLIPKKEDIIEEKSQIKIDRNRSIKRKTSWEWEL